MLTMDTLEQVQINGKWKPTRNSEGRLIHSTPEGIYNFWRWFGDSKVVDEEGRPLVVYHGGTVEPDVDIAEVPMHFGTKRAAEDRVAVLDGSKYIDEAVRDLYFDDEDDTWWVGEMGPFETREDATSWISDQAANINDNIEEFCPVHAFYLRILRPRVVMDANIDALKIDDECYDPDDDPWQDIIESLPASCDGLKYRNAFEDRNSWSWVALDARSIKSAEHNTGEFSSQNFKMANPRRKRGRRRPC